MGLREAIRDKPAAGWAVFGVLIAIAVVLWFTQFRAADHTADLAQDITIRYEDTGTAEQVNRGKFETLLMQLSASGELRVDEGMTNPSTGKKTGYPVDRAYWERIVKGILAARAQYDAERKKAPPPPGGRRR